jgi:hypothetical protein
VFSFFLADLDPKSIKLGSSLLNPSQLEAMDSAQISQLLVAIADTLDKPKPVANKTPQSKNNRSLVNVLNVS